MFKLGLSTNSKVINEELFANYKKSGINFMEVSTSWDKYASLDYKMISKWAKKYGITLWSFHLPFMPFEELDISHPELCKATISYHTELIKKAADIGIDKFIIHPSGEPISDKERAARLNCAKESLFKLSEVAIQHGATLAVEDLPRTCLGRDSAEIQELISVHDSLRVCFDTNHLLTEEPVDFIHKLGDRIITTHVSDYDFTDEKHWMPGEGKLDWQSLIKALHDVNYSGIWLYEIAFTNTVKITRTRDLTCEDFVKNADELFSNKELTIIP